MTPKLKGVFMVKWYDVDFTKITIAELSKKTGVKYPAINKIKTEKRKISRTNKLFQAMTEEERNTYLIPVIVAKKVNKDKFEELLKVKTNVLKIIDRSIKDENLRNYILFTEKLIIEMYDKNELEYFLYQYYSDMENKLVEINKDSISKNKVSKTLNRLCYEIISNTPKFFPFIEGDIEYHLSNQTKLI